MIIDFHSHIKREKESKKYLAEELIEDMNQYQIDLRMVSAIEGRSIVEQNRYISSLVEQYPDRLVGAAMINPKNDQAVEEVEEALALPGIKCVEMNALEHGYFPEKCEQINDILKVVEKYHVPVKVFTGIGAMSLPQQWAIYAKRFPKVDFVMLHMGCFDFGYSCVDVAKELDNVFVETSNQYEVQILNKAFQQLPKEKIIFGSLYAERLTKCSIDLFELFHLDQDMLDAIYFRNAKKLLGIE
ncbi:hypothetical protein SAMN05444392_10557 [Seinonella peptonophila]|uniref:Amidohydrolase-related domain-containing protein n=1 Tax=Seinonella peptonophila TaxID=112248 RepID=A0A1M4XLA6_9BACL|nr:amidohydrolase family protein [Seinonella peptonophila]SHE94168.1 hypothetical protein SAMN05444392_10557 [Seinonella peptonophila]